MRKRSHRQPVHRGLDIVRSCRENSLGSVRACHGRPGCRFWKPSICSFRTIPPIIPVSLNFWLQCTVRKILAIATQRLTRSIKKQFCSEFTRHPSPANVYGSQLYTLFLPAKRWVWTNGRHQQEREVAAGHLLSWLPPTSLPRGVCLLLLKIAAPVSHPLLREFWKLSFSLPLQCWES